MNTEKKFDGIDILFLYVFLMVMFFAYVAAAFQNLFVFLTSILIAIVSIIGYTLMIDRETKKEEKVTKENETDLAEIGRELRLVIEKIEKELDELEK